MKDLLTPAELAALLNPPNHTGPPGGAGPPEFSAHNDEGPSGHPPWDVHRRFNRYERHRPVELRVGPLTVPGRLEDIGIGGARLVTVGDVPLSFVPVEGATVQVRVATPEMEVALAARVLWLRTRRRGFELGVRFDALSPVELSELMGFLEVSARGGRHPATTTPPRSAQPDEDDDERRGA